MKEHPRLYHYSPLSPGIGFQLEPLKISHPGKKIDTFFYSNLIKHSYYSFKLVWRKILGCNFILLLVLELIFSLILVVFFLLVRSIDITLALFLSLIQLIMLLILFSMLYIKYTLSNGLGFSTLWLKEWKGLRIEGSEF